MDAPSTSRTDTYRVHEPATAPSDEAPLVGLGDCKPLVEYLLVRSQQFPRAFGATWATQALPRRFALQGPPGSGKRTTVLRAARRGGLLAVECAAVDLVHGALERLGADIARRGKGAVVVFDHCDNLFDTGAPPSGFLQDYERLIRQLDTKLPRFCVCWLTARNADALAVVLGDCGDQVRRVGPLSRADRTAALQEFIRGHMAALPPGAQLTMEPALRDKLVDASDYCTPAEIRVYCQRALTRRYRLGASDVLSAAEGGAAPKALWPRADDFEAELHRDMTEAQWSLSSLPRAARIARYTPPAPVAMAVLPPRPASAPARWAASPTGGALSLPPPVGLAGLGRDAFPMQQ